MKQKSLTFKGLIKRYTGVLSLVEKQNAKKFKRIKKLENIKPKDEEKLSSEEINSRKIEAHRLKEEVDKNLQNLKVFLDASFEKIETLLDDSKKSIKKKAKYENLPEISKLVTEGYTIVENQKQDTQPEIEDEVEEIEISEFAVPNSPMRAKTIDSVEQEPPHYEEELIKPIPLVDENEINNESYTPYINIEETNDLKVERDDSKEYEKQRKQSKHITSEEKNTKRNSHIKTYKKYGIGSKDGRSKS